MKGPEFRTERLALTLWLLLQLPVVIGSVWMALTPSSDFIVGLILLGPFEVVRLVVLIALAAAYQKYLNPRQALYSFALRVFPPLLFFVGLFAFYWTTTFGVASLIENVSRPWLWVAIVIPTALIVTESAMALIVFNGDPRSQAARLSAMAADSKAWLGLALLFFALILVLFLVAAAGRTPAISVSVVVLILVYPALYFSGKAIVLAHVYTGRFMRTGRRALDAPWILHLMTGRTPGGYRQVAADEEKAADSRRLALRGLSVNDIA